MVGFTVAQAGIEQENIRGFGVGAEAKVALATAELGAHVENGNLHIGAEATLVKYESAIKIPLPFSDKNYKLEDRRHLGQSGIFRSWKKWSEIPCTIWSWCRFMGIWWRICY